MKIKRKIIAASIAGFLSLAGTAHADYNPSGVQNDVAFSDVISGGWSVVYQGNYDEMAVDISSIFGSIAAGSRVMLAARHNPGESGPSANFDVLAAASKEDILTYTAWNATHAANGAEWYFNGYSMGFAGMGDSIYQNTADVDGLDERDRLSWHTSLNGEFANQDHTAAPNYIDAGWRSGDNLYLNGGYDWQRYVLVQTAPVPEPETYAMMLAGLGLLGLMRRRKARSA